MATKGKAGQERQGAPTAGSAAGAVAGSVGPENVSPNLLAISSLPRVDYADHFVLTLDQTPPADPELWARTMLGDTPDLIERLLWSGVLGLHLHAGKSPATIAGWRITERGDDWISMSAASRNISAALIIRVTAATLELATLVQCDRARARAIWAPTAFVHRRLVPFLLRSTDRTMSEGSR